MKNVPPEDVLRIRKKVDNLFYFPYGFCYDQEKLNERERFLDNKVIYYLQVGESVLDSEIELSKKSSLKK